MFNSFGRCRNDIVMNVWGLVRAIILPWNRMTDSPDHQRKSCQSSWPSMMMTTTKKKTMLFLLMMTMIVMIIIIMIIARLGQSSDSSVIRTRTSSLMMCTIGHERMRRHFAIRMWFRPHPSAEPLSKLSDAETAVAVAQIAVCLLSIQLRRGEFTPFHDEVMFLDVQTKA